MMIIHFRYHLVCGQHSTLPNTRVHLWCLQHLVYFLFSSVCDPLVSADQASAQHPDIWSGRYWQRWPAGRSGTLEEPLCRFVWDHISAGPPTCSAHHQLPSACKVQLHLALPQVVRGNSGGLQFVVHGDSLWLVLQNLTQLFKLSPHIASVNGHGV